MSSDVLSEGDAFETAVERGDAARGAKAWDVAARHYRRAVESRPQAARIWMQLGHAIKEQGDLESAEAAYLTAQRLQPDDGDAHLQLGHLHMLRGDLERAVPCYKRARALGIDDEHALNVLIAAGADFEVAPPAEGAAIAVIYLDVSDLVAYFQEKRHPTGIQRMEIELVKASRSWRGATPLRICSFGDEAAFWVDVDPVALCELCDLAAAPGAVSDPSWRAAVAAFTRRLGQRKACEMPAGAALINLGPRTNVDYMAAVREAKARFGLRYVPFIHDLIPIIIPEHLPSAYAGVFNSWFGSVIMHADAVVTNSECTRRDVVRLSERVRMLPEPPVVVRLDARMGSLQDVAAADRRLVLERRGLAGREFVLCVSTLEARKNHLLVFRAWARLLDQHPDGDVPLLVCVGHRGWQFDQAEAFLEVHQALRRHVVVMSGAGDVELQVLYQACLFTVYSSFYEGWGLPITESLCYGKVCLTPDHSSLPEAGGPFAEYFEEDSVRSLAIKAETLIWDREHREARELAIAEGFRPRTWSEVLAGMIDGLLPQLQAPQSPRTGVAAVELGTVYEIGKPPAATMPERTRAVGEMLRADQGWHGVEDWGVFSKQAVAALRFLPDLASAEDPASGDILVYIKLRASREPVEVAVQVETEASRRLSLAANEQRVVQARIPAEVFRRHVERGAQISVHLRAGHMTDLRRHTTDDVRQIGVGVEFFAICLADDASTRMAMIERCCLEQRNFVTA